MKETNEMNLPRRTVLKGAGIVGLTTVVGMSGTVAAKNGDLKKYKDVDAFLNHPAAFKDPVIWDGTVVDRTGTASTSVDVGAFTSVNVPGVPIPAAPVAYDPQVIEVDPGTEVTWEWLNLPFPPAGPDGIPHDVVAKKKVKGEPMFASELQYPADATPFSVTFETPGEYLYYCTPHGAPFAVESPFKKGKVNNEFGMRGAVIVLDE